MSASARWHLVGERNKAAAEEITAALRSSTNAAAAIETITEVVRQVRMFVAEQGPGRSRWERSASLDLRLELSRLEGTMRAKAFGTSCREEMVSHLESLAELVLLAAEDLQAGTESAAAVGMPRDDIDKAVELILGRSEHFSSSRLEVGTHWMEATTDPAAAARSAQQWWERRGVAVAADLPELRPGETAEPEMEL